VAQFLRAFVAVTPLSGYPASVLQYLDNRQHAVSFPAGQVLFREGDRADVMYVLLEGMADILVGGIHVDLAVPGSLIGEMALVDNSLRSATVVCHTPCRFGAIDQARFDSLVKETPSFAKHVMTLMAQRIRRMNEKISEKASKGKSGRPGGQHEQRPGDMPAAGSHQAD
jgi:CRP-like cAMP-binding protein